ncbi:MAG: TetR/AcrR family transcriptional regulator [Myxococcota bacterium]
MPPPPPEEAPKKACGGSRREAQRAETTAKLIRAARTMFREHGYAGTSMDHLCANAGLTRGALYHYFGGKEGLLLAVVRQISEEMGAELDALCAGGENAWVGFRAACRRYLEMSLEPEVRQIVLQDAPGVLGARLRELDLEAVEAIQGALKDVMDEGFIPKQDPEPLARLLDGATNELAMWIAASDTPEQELDRAWASLSAVLDGLEVKV